MKNTRKLSKQMFSLLCFTLLFFSVSCNKEASQKDQIDDIWLQPIKISGSDSQSGTKTTLNGLSTVWIETTDKVGVYSPQARPTPSGSVLANTESFFPQTKAAYGVTNTPYTAMNSGASANFEGSMYWGGGSHAFFAYYPYVAGLPPHTAVPISLPSEQTQNGISSSHIGALDFMVATPVTVVTPGTPGESAVVHFLYNHVFSLLEFKLKSTVGGGKISRIKLSAPTTNICFGSGTLNIAQSKPAAGSPYTISQTATGKEITVTITGGITPTEDYASTPSIFMMINPGDHTGDNMTISIEWEGHGPMTNITKVGQLFARGMKYVVQQDVTPPANPWSGTPVTIGTTIWAPVNAGYDADHKYGLMYQWGRKYGQGYDVTETPNLTNVPGPITIDVGNNVININNVYTLITDPWDWCTPQAASWSMVAYNPCPAGWRVPTYNELNSLITAGSMWVASGGPDNLAGSWFGTDHSGARTNSIFMPAGGYRNSPGTVSSRNTRGVYWSSDINGTKAYYLEFINLADPSIYNDSRAYGHQIRCVKE